MPNLLDKLERLEQAATPGPWAIHTDLRKWVMNDDPRAEWGINRDNDAAFVVAARNALPALLRVARAAQQRQICEQCGGKGIYWIDVDGEAEAEACDCTVELTEALAALESEAPQ